MNYEALAARSIAKTPLTKQEALGVLNTPDPELLQLLGAAYKVRHHYRGDHVHVQLLSNIKSGNCSEDCSYCSQSKVSEAPVERYGLWEQQQAQYEARRATAMDAKRYCMALAGGAPSDRDIDRLSGMIRAIKQDNPIEMCLSIGFLTPAQAKKLKDAGLDRINHNLNTSERHYPAICSTHSYADRVRNLKIAKDAGLDVCSGGIVGQGETDEDIYEMFASLVEIQPASIPINFLIPVEGTPLAGHDTQLTPRRCLKVLSLCRFMHPDVDIRVAGGRERHLRSLQPMSMYPANSLFVEGYLTTGGMAQPEAIKMIRDLGFTLEIEGAEESSIEPPEPATPELQPALGALPIAS